MDEISLFFYLTYWQSRPEGLVVVFDYGSTYTVISTSCFAGASVLFLCVMMRIILNQYKNYMKLFAIKTEGFQTNAITIQLFAQQQYLLFS